MKELAVDESLSEEARDSAKKALDVLVSSQLLDIEQAAALKQRVGALKDLESEALFVDQQAQIENRKLEAAALAEVQKMEAEATKVEAEAQSKRKKLEAEAQAKTLLQIAELESSAAAEGLSEELTEWQKRHRLQKCAAAIARVAGDNILPSDLQYLTDENVDEIGSGLTHVERMRLQAALRAVGVEDKAGTE